MQKSLHLTPGRLHKNLLLLKETTQTTTAFVSKPRSALDMQKGYRCQSWLIKKLQERCAPCTCEQGTPITHAVQHSRLSSALHHWEHFKNRAAIKPAAAARVSQAKPFMHWQGSSKQCGVRDLPVSPSLLFCNTWLARWAPFNPYSGNTGCYGFLLSLAVRGCVGGLGTPWT